MKRSIAMNFFGESKKQQIERLQSEIDKLHAENDALKSKHEELESEYNTLNVKYKDAQKQNRTYRNSDAAGKGMPRNRI